MINKALIILAKIGGTIIIAPIIGWILMRVAAIILLLLVQVPGIVDEMPGIVSIILCIVIFFVSIAAGWELSDYAVEKIRCCNRQ